MLQFCGQSFIWFGFLSIFAYLVGMLIFRRFPHPLTTPLLLATIFVIVFLKLLQFTRITT